MKLYSIILALLAILTASAFSQETLYPSGYDIQCQYSLSDAEISIADTLIISRKVVNNESFILENLYFCENIPLEFEVAEYSATINEIEISCLFSGPISNDVVDGYDAYYWVFDSPYGAEEVNNILNPGDSIVLEFRITSGDVGIYSLPLHSTVFFGNGSGFFSTSDEISVEFILSLDIAQDGEETDRLPVSHLIGHAYPNPFNSAVKISYSGAARNRLFKLEIYNILGQNIYSKRFITDDSHGEIFWTAGQFIGTGIYFYRLSSANESFSGKLLLLK